MQQQNGGGGKLLRNRSRAELRVNSIFDFPFSVCPAAGFVEFGLAVYLNGSRPHEPHGPRSLAGLLEIVMELGLKIGGGKKLSGSKRADKDPSHHEHMIMIAVVIVSQMWQLYKLRRE